MRWIIGALAALIVAAGPAAAQQQPGQRDPFNGQFGAMEIAPAPQEGARQGAMGDALNAGAAAGPSGRI